MGRFRRLAVMSGAEYLGFTEPLLHVRTDDKISVAVAPAVLSGG
jgi:hypothetical protein